MRRISAEKKRNRSKGPTRKEGLWHFTLMQVRLGERLGGGGSVALSTYLGRSLHKVEIAIG